MSVNRLLRTATQWRAAWTPTSAFALVGVAGSALIMALVVAASRAGVRQAGVDLPNWWGPWPTGDQARPGWGAAVVAIVCALCVVWLHVARTWLRADRPLPKLQSAGLLALVWASPLALTGPIGSLDVQSYAAVGRLAQLGMDPYHYGPGWVHGPYAAAVSPEWLWTPTPYGPLQVALLREVAVTVGNHVGLAVLLIRAVAAIGLAMAVVLALHASSGRDRPVVLLLTALNPLVLVHVLSGAHLDILIGALALLVVLLVRADRPGAAMVAAVVACLLKMPGLLLVGYVGLDVLRRTPRPLLKVRLAQVVAAAAATVLATVALVPDAFGFIGALSVPGTIRTALAPSTWVSWLVAGVTGLTDPAGMTVATTVGRTLTELAGAALVIRLLWHATDGPERSAYAGVGWGMVVLAFAGPTTYPWYLTWGLFAAAVGSRLRGRLVLFGLCIAYALLGGYAGSVVGVLVMVAAFAVAGVALWRAWRDLVVVNPVVERPMTTTIAVRPVSVGALDLSTASRSTLPTWTP